MTIRNTNGVLLQIHPSTSYAYHLIVVRSTNLTLSPRRMLTIACRHHPTNVRNDRSPRTFAHPCSGSCVCVSTHDRHHRITGDHLKIAVKTAKDLNMRNAEHIVGPSDLPLLEKDGARARPRRHCRVLRCVWGSSCVSLGTSPRIPRRRHVSLSVWVVMRKPLPS